MGGLLVGHIGSEGEVNVVSGFFPEQIRASPGYCEFDGSWVAIAASACDHANTASTSGSSPDLRVVGWIHTHPDLGLFLSSIDISTYTSLRGMSPDSKFIAIVVDPLRGEDGVFPSEHMPNHYTRASGNSELSEEMAEKYNHFLDRIQEVRAAKGSEKLPAVLPGDLRLERILRGDPDDSHIAFKRGFQKLKSRHWELEDQVSEMRLEISQLRSSMSEISAIRRRLDEFLDSRRRNYSLLSRLIG
jgi:proteasome lid subunit RPN8/RPN11